MMDIKAASLWISVICVCNAIPIFQPQLGIVASASNEILGLGGVTLTGVGLGQTQGTSFINPFFRPNVIMPQRVLNFNPQAAGPFLPQQATPGLLPAQGNQGSPFQFNPAQQDMPTGPQFSDPNSPQFQPQVFPQYYPSMAFPQGAGGQGYPYYMSYGYPQRNTPGVVQPNPNNAQQNIVQTTQKPQQPIQNPGKGGDTLNTTSPPDTRGDMAGPVIEEGYPRFSFLP
ncbi:uncharacterized protein odam [Alosa sapidissima]|uniref:uncharacterized protein odam n=1 Tax=Alosa sapidissima TaxID=34773 RepID=UPI001C08FCBC|nr:uncharacterized protein odam [Alosa sapidissima]